MRHLLLMLSLLMTAATAQGAFSICEFALTHKLESSLETQNAILRSLKARLYEAARRVRQSKDDEVVAVSEAEVERLEALVTALESGVADAVVVARVNGAENIKVFIENHAVALNGKSAPRDPVAQAKRDQLKASAIKGIFVLGGFVSAPLMSHYVGPELTMTALFSAGTAAIFGMHARYEKNAARFQEARQIEEILGILDGTVRVWGEKNIHLKRDFDEGYVDVFFRSGPNTEATMDLVFWKR